MDKQDGTKERARAAQPPSGRISCDNPNGRWVLGHHYAWRDHDRRAGIDLASHDGRELQAGILLPWASDAQPSGKRRLCKRTRVVARHLQARSEQVHWNEVKSRTHAVSTWIEPAGSAQAPQKSPETADAMQGTSGILTGCLE